MSTTRDSAASLSLRLQSLSRHVSEQLNQDPVPDARIEIALDQAVNVSALVNNLAEIWRVSPDQVREQFEANGFDSLLARDPDLKSAGAKPTEPVAAEDSAADWRKWGGPEVRVRCFKPNLTEGSRTEGAGDLAIKAFLGSAQRDPFVPLFRSDVRSYHDEFCGRDLPRIQEYVAARFGTKGPRYLINSGIGANEQFNHLVSALDRARPDRRLEWHTVNSTGELSGVPSEARVENTLFMEFSRSGITEETIKLHEFTPREASRVVFANKGPLRTLGERDDNLVLNLPDEISGRFGRNKTPILLAPMCVAGLDTRAYWDEIDRLCQSESLTEPDTLPVRLAAYIRTQQMRLGINHIYMGTSHPLLLHSADEFCQFWNEGPNKNGNDILMSRYLGLPRDSHMNLEGILADHQTKLAVFLICSGSAGVIGSEGPTNGLPATAGHPLLCSQITPADPKHANLTVDEHDLILTLANLKRCSELMPTIVVVVPRVDLTASARLGQLWADVTFVYSRLVNVDPGSNPEVKAVRTRAADWLADKSAAFQLLQ